MARYNINKGIGKPAEFKGLKSQYLFIFAGGLLSIFILFVIIYMAGVSQTISIGIGVTLSALLVHFTFSLNKKYGEHGLMKKFAIKRHPRYLINRLPLSKMLKNNHN